ncbi:hypothetical protein ACDH54_28275, partial [Pseudomonas syringae]
LDTEKNKAAYRVLGSTPFCLAVLMLEVWNVSSESEALKQTVREKNSARALLGLTSAILDLSVAMEALTVKLLGSRQKPLHTRKILWKISGESVKKILGTKLTKLLTKEISIRLGAQVASGTLLTGLNLYDA